MSFAHFGSAFFGQSARKRTSALRNRARIASLLAVALLPDALQSPCQRLQQRPARSAARSRLQTPAHAAPAAEDAKHAQQLDALGPRENIITRPRAEHGHGARRRVAAMEVNLAMNLEDAKRYGLEGGFRHSGSSCGRHVEKLTSRADCSDRWNARRRPSLTGPSSTLSS